MQCPQEILKTIVYAKFGGQTKCIMGNSKTENTISVASRIRGTWFLTNLSTDIYLYLLITLCSQFCRCLLSNRGDNFFNPLYVKGAGCFLKVPCKFQICNVQVHYQYMINIKLVPRMSFGNMAKSMLSAFTNDNGFKFSINLLPESLSSGCKIQVTGKAYGV